MRLVADWILEIKPGVEQSMEAARAAGADHKRFIRAVVFNRRGDIAPIA
jgi:hypothetical protein